MPRLGGDPRDPQDTTPGTLDALGPAPRAELLHVLVLPDFERADRIGEFWSHSESRTFAELLIDLEEDKAARGGRVRVARED